VDLSILDVLQIFGRAGRPQYDTTGHALLITPHKSLASYLGMLTNQAPIESALIKALPDHLNAEIVNGTVNNIKEAAAWLSYTFLFVRMCRNPLAYGMNHEELFSDPRLEAKRLQLVREAADTLDSCMMCRYDKRSGNLAVTNLGRIASHYYIRYGTVEAFNTMLAPHLSSGDALHVLCSSAEFDQLKVRPEELSELDTLRKGATLAVRATTDDTAGKVNVLLQGYLNKAAVGSFTLQSDTNYVAQNAGRITRALFEICLKRGWSTMANLYLGLCKSIDRRMLPHQSPLRQFQELPKEVLQRLEDTDATPDRLLDMTAREVGQLIHNQKLGARALSLAQQLPQLSVETVVQPITRGILRLLLTLRADFEWSERYHGPAEAFWVWVEDGESEYIYHAEHVIISRRERSERRELEVTIPVREPLPPQYYVRVVSDSWVGCERVATVSFRDLILPTMAPTHTDLLALHPVPRTALQHLPFEALYSFSHFNPIQSQMFHALYHTDVNILVGAPTGSGKTITGELALLRLLRESPGAKCIYVAPLKALARERLQDWQRKFGGGGAGKGGVKLRILELTGDVTPSLEELNRADLLIVTPEKWDSITRGWQRRSYVQRVQLVIIDEIHLLGVDRGPVLVRWHLHIYAGLFQKLHDSCTALPASLQEVIVSRMRFISTHTARPIRFVGLSTALANPRDLADWLGIGEVGVYNFRSAVRPVPLTTHIQVSLTCLVTSIAIKCLVSPASPRRRGSPASTTARAWPP
jgi:activating signal cointegrator complex subunit 3